MLIGICDDDVTFRKKIKMVIGRYADKKEDWNITEFETGDELLDSMVTDSIPDILFLDVEMPGKNGLETAEYIREQHKDMIIIITSSYREYILDSFHVKAFYFLVKPVDESVLIKEFKRAVMEYERDHIKYKIRVSGQTIEVVMNEIYYLSAYYRTIHLFTKTNEYLYEGKLNEEEMKLKQEGFLRVHQGFLVNMRYIKMITDSKVILVNGVEVDMSVRKRTEVKRKYNKFLLGGEV